jgi:transcriptional regulator with XRE-family HTH domain
MKIFTSMLLHLVRDSSGFSGYDGEILGLTLSFYLTIMVHSPDSSNYPGAEKRRGEQALALRNQTMATTLVSVETREVVRCDSCSLVQYRTSNSLCRKCRRPLDIEEPAPLAPQLVTTQPVPQTAEAGLQVAGQVREIRRARHLSQRQLAGRMQVPRTYISKIENGKAIPTLGSLERLANALEVDISQLVRDSRSRREEEVAAILADPFLAEIAALLPQLDSLHRTLIYGSIRDASTGRRRTA